MIEIKLNNIVEQKKYLKQNIIQKVLIKKSYYKCLKKLFEFLVLKQKVQMF